jgi:hypothetical protein
MAKLTGQELGILIRDALERNAACIEASRVRRRPTRR